MAVTALNDVFLLTFRGSLAGQTILNTFWYRIIAVPGGQTVQQTIAEMQTDITKAGALVPDFLACCPSNYTLTQIWWQKVHPTRLMKAVFSINQLGQSGFDASTANLAAVITRRGEAANRRNVGHLHVPLPDPVNVAAGGEIPANAYKVDLGDLANEMKVLLSNVANTLSAEPVIFNPRSAVFLPRLVVATEVQDTVRVMRRRTVRVGI